MLKRVLQSFAGMILVVLAGDLLYLYFAGGWYDPNRVIEITEVTMLCLLIPLGLYVAVSNVKRT